MPSTRRSKRGRKSSSGDVDAVVHPTVEGEPNKQRRINGSNNDVEEGKEEEDNRNVETATQQQPVDSTSNPSSEPHDTANTSASINQQILEVLQNIDARLGRIEQQLQQARLPHQRENQRNARQRRSIGPSFLHQPSDTFVQGSWTFVESPDTIRRRDQHQKEKDNAKLPGYSCTHYYDGSFWKAGNSDGVGLKGEHYPTSFLRSQGLFYYRLGLGP